MNRYAVRHSGAGSIRALLIGVLVGIVLALLV